DVTRLQALVDRKKIMISEVVIRKILQLDNAEGVVCFPNEEIFAGLAQIGYEMRSTKLTFYKAFFSSQWKFLIHTLIQSLSAKRTSWNEFSTTMASANQVGDLSTHTTRFISPALTQKVFANMRRVRKGFSEVETPLFEGMLVARALAKEEIAEEQVQADDVVAATVQETIAEDVAEDVANEVIPSTPTPLILPSPPSHDILSTTQKWEIIKLKARVKRLERDNKVKSSKLRRLRKVGASKRIESSDDMENVFNQGRMIYDLDKYEGIELVVNQVKDADIAETKGRHAIEQAEKQAEIYHLDLDHPSKVLSMQEDDSKVQEVVEPSILVAAPTSVAAYTRRRKGVTIKDPEDELSSKTPAETPKLKDKGKEAQEVEDLKKHLEVVDDEDDDVFTEATPLARKVPVMDY
nr:hypothetical protein [Tanacetum cinerariifolium]